MIAGVLHQGSGLGNQLHRYVMTRVLAADKKVDWAMFYNPDGSGKEEGFKGKSFMPINWPPAPEAQKWHQFFERKLVLDGVDVRGYDPEINFVQDNTIIEGEFQDERYFQRYMPQLAQFCPTENLQVKDDTCIVGFRGGEFKAIPDLFLPYSYYEKAMNLMRERGVTRFEVHTDDPELAKEYFRSETIIHDIGINWRSTRYAKYAIIPNSSFYILPRLMAHFDQEALTIAPRYWARHTTKVWALPQNYYSQFTYIHGEDTH